MVRCLWELCCGQNRCRSAATVGTSFRSSRRDRPVGIVRAAPVAHARPRGCAPPCRSGPEISSVRRSSPPTIRCSQSARSGSIFPIRSAWRPASISTPRCPTLSSSSVLASLRSGRSLPSGTGRECAAPALSARSRPRRDQSSGFQQRRRRRGAAPSRRTCKRRRHRRDQYRRQQGKPRSPRRLRATDRNLRAGRELLLRQYLLAQHPGSARPAAGTDARQSPRAGDGCAGPHEPGGRNDPVLIKIAPDSHAQRARRHRRGGAPAPRRRHDHRQHHRDCGHLAARGRETAREAGGLSGTPALSLATRMLAESLCASRNAFPLIGVGGIDLGEAAMDKIRAGAVPDPALQCARIPRAEDCRGDQVRAVERAASRKSANDRRTSGRRTLPP